MAKVREKASSAGSRDRAEDRTARLPFDLSLPGGVRFDRYGNAIAGTGSTLVQKLAGSSDTKDGVTRTAQRVMERARETVGSALEQMPEVSLPAVLPSVSLPGHKRRRGPSKLLVIGIALGVVATAGFLLYRWLNAGGEPLDYGIQESWPAEPSPGPVNEPRQDDAEASADAEQSLAARDGGATSPINP